jgi:hypothetical protein
MFVPDFNKSIPGYTGHRQTTLDDSEDQQQIKDPRKQIPGKLIIICDFNVNIL